MTDAVGTKITQMPSGRPPSRSVFNGNYVRLEPLDPRKHAEPLFELGHADEEAVKIWRYLPYGPFDTLESMRFWLEQNARSADPMFFAVIDQRDQLASGICTLMRITPKMGVIETGHIWYTPKLQRTPAPTEAMFLLFSHVFDELGYRRMEWKCNALNQASRDAALRFGFSFEGIFRQHLIVKGRNRDTAWFSIIDSEWPSIRTGMRSWLAANNFNEDGQQQQRLADLIAASRQA